MNWGLLKSIVDKDENVLDEYSFYFDGQAITETLQPAYQIIEYKARDIKNLCIGSFGFTQLHAMYRFKATIIYYLPKQSLINRLVGR